MYYILYEGLKIESNEPVYCTVYNVHYTMYTVHCTLYSVPQHYTAHIYIYTIVYISCRCFITNN